MDRKQNPGNVCKRAGDDMPKPSAAVGTETISRHLRPMKAVLPCIGKGGEARQ